MNVVAASDNERSSRGENVFLSMKPAKLRGHGAGLRMTRGNGNGEGTRNIDVAKAGITVGFLDPNLHLGMCQWFQRTRARLASHGARLATAATTGSMWPLSN